MPNRRKKRPQPLVARQPTMSRKRARHVTTAFHRLMRSTASDGDDSSSCTKQQQQQQAVVEAARVEYQRASQVSTTFYSTSKWVLAELSLRGWVYGIPLPVPPKINNHDLQDEKRPSSSNGNTTSTATAHKHMSKTDGTTNISNNTTATIQPKHSKQRIVRRPTQLLEIGAINTQMLDAATQRSGYALQVRAIDLHAMDRRIEEADFLTLPLPTTLYDVIVCSMVLNCLPTPDQRGEMLCRLYHFVRPNGLVFLTLPRTCLQLSPYIDKSDFVQLLTALGLVVRQTKESPKVAFFICERVSERPWGGHAWTLTKRYRNGHKYTNDFAAVLNKRSFDGKTIKKRVLKEKT